MPSKNTLKIYTKDGIYHVYNRGVEKRKIFLNKQDYQVFLYYLKLYLVSPDQLNQKEIPLRARIFLDNSNLYKRINLFAYCLMPNHFHFMLKQLDETAMTEFIRKLCTAYVKYFNEKYQRVGPLFQGRYKAILIDKESHFLHLSRYIHQNPLEIMEKSTPTELINYSYSSYSDYIGKRNTSWIHKEEILEYFKSAQKYDLKGFLSYQDFVENYKISPEESLGELTLENP